MLRNRPGYLPALAALTATLLASVLMVAVSTAGAESGMALGVLALVLLPVPLVLSVLWGSAVVSTRPHRLALAAAALWLVAAWLLFPGATTWPMASNVAAGLVAGIALGARWRLDAALGGIALVLVPLTVWSVVEMPLGEQMDLFHAELMPVLEENLPEGADPAQRREALALEEERLEQMADLLARIYPFFLGIGLLGQGLLILFLVWLVLRMLGWRLASWRPPPFGTWRVPFYLVWLLALGLGLMVTRQPLAVHGGLNLALLAATVLSIQGLAVQFHVTARVLSPMGRVVFWTVAGLFLIPVVLPLGVVLGLADQWLDLRGLDRPAAETDDDKEA